VGADADNCGEVFGGAGAGVVTLEDPKTHPQTPRVGHPGIWSWIEDREVEVDVSGLRAWFVRLGGVVGRERRDAELAAELESHLELHIEENLRAGMSAEQARRDALMNLGGLEQTKEIYRERRGLPWFETLLQDLRFGARVMRKSPGFTAVAIFTLALGIGANSAVFSVVNAVILRPLPYADSERLVNLNSKAGMFPDMTLYLSWPGFQQVRAGVSSFQQSAIDWNQPKVLAGRGDPQLLQVDGVSDGFFEQLGTRALLGRLLGDSDQEQKNGRVIVLSESLWRTRFGSNPKIAGEKLTLDHNLYTVVGVAEKGFAYPDQTDTWTPIEVPEDSKQNPMFYAFDFLGKLKPGVDLAQLNAELKTVSAQMQKQYPQLKDGYNFLATRLLDGEVSDARRMFYLLLAAATVLLLIACSNLAGMLLSRGWGRQEELAIRAALGASRVRIFRQILAESCLLGAAGGLAGIAFAALGVRLFQAVAPEDTPRLAEIHPDWNMVGFALASAVVTGVLFGLAPARHAMRVAINQTLKEAGSARSTGGGFSTRVGSLLVAGEIAMAFVLLIGAGLMTQTVWRLLRQDPGFRTENLLAFDLYRPSLQSESDRKKNAPVQIAQIKAILESVQRLPGVQSVAAVNPGVLNGVVAVHGGLRLEDSDVTGDDNGFAVTVRHVSPGYFKTLGIALRRGREFSEQDSAESGRVAIVNERMAKHYWGTVDVVGKHLDTFNDGVWSEIVGVVSDSRDVEIRDEPHAEYYVPLLQDTTGSCLLVRAGGNPSALIPTVTKQIWSEFPELPVTSVMSVQQAIEKYAGNEKLQAVLLGAFAGTGLLLALAGTYGVIAYAVERQKREIGIRIALGASRSDVLVLVGKHAFLPVLAGIAVGVPVAIAAEKAIASELYGVRPIDPLTFTVAALLMICVAAAACWVPGRRAMRVDPMVALRYE
jgi:predicted permease